MPVKGNRNIFDLEYQIQIPINSEKFASSLENISEERELIDNLLVRTTLQSEMNHDLWVTLKAGSESSLLVAISIVAVILLFFCGVIYPLSFLPLELNTEISLSISAFWDILFSLKGTLLTLMSFIFCGLMIIFFYVNHRLRHNNKTLYQLKWYSCICNYSIYFKNYNDYNESLYNSIQSTDNAATD